MATAVALCVASPTNKRIPNFVVTTPGASLFSLPIEIRLSIYDLLLTSSGSDALAIRTVDPAVYEAQKHQTLRRSKYRISSGRFRARSEETTYSLVGSPGIHPAILRVNKQIRSEATHVLYSNHIFDFGQDVESAVPFLSDLTPATLKSVKRINIVKRALPRVQEFDRCEWRNVCDFVAQNMELKRLGLGIMGSTPTSTWAAADTFEKADFNTITKFDSMDWVKQLVTIRGLQMLDIKAHLEHCAPPRSNAIAFFVNFSASIERGFAEYLREHMVLGG
jgi:hypothetical protein